MKQSIGGLAGLLAIIGLLIHTQSPTSSENAATQAAADSKNKKSNPAKKEENTSDPPPEGPWIATRSFFVPKSEIPAPPKDLFDPKSADAKGELQRLLGLPQPGQAEMWSIVATVADPLHTRLSLFLDNQLEAIERAFQATGWDFAGQWLPWMDHADPAETDISNRRKQRRLQSEQEDYPGILIFRSPPGPPGRPDFAKRALFVLLVPETPTTGINGRSFFAAMNFARAVVRASKPGPKIGLLAPSFTGSFSSLSHLLAEWDRNNSPGIISQAVYGGSISGQEYATAFENSFADPECKCPAKYKFYSGIVDSEGYRHAYEAVLSGYGIKPDQAAYLRENATGFSRSFIAAASPAGTAQIPVFVFPRDISHLRNAYQDVAVTSARSNPEHTPGIDFSIKDPENGEDSIPIFSTVQTPLSQNSIVDSITAQLRRNNTRIVFIAATNPLDALFLTQLVRRNSPGTRVLVGNADVLFVAAAYREGLSGTLFLSSYPLFLQGGQWLDGGGPPQDLLKFAGPNFQGIFNVAQLLARDLGANFSDSGQTHLHGYGQLKNNRPYPGLWLLTLSRSGFLPLDVPDSPQGLLASHPHSSPTPLPDEPPPSEWFMTALLATAAIFVYCFLLVACNFGLMKRPLWLVVADQVEIRLIALFGVCLSLSALSWVLAFPFWRAVEVAIYEGRYPELGLGTILAAIATAASFIVPFLSLLMVAAKGTKQDATAESGIEKAGWRLQEFAYVLIAGTLFVIVTAEWAVSCMNPENPGFMFRFRALELYSGESPAVPFVLLTIAFFGISHIYYKRYTEAGKIRPILPLDRLPNWPELQEPRRLSRGIESAIMAPGHLPLRDWSIRLGVCTFFVFICAMILAHGARVYAFELWHYNWALLAAIIVLLFCLATGCYDLVRIWTHLSRLLERLDLLSLNVEMDRVSEKWFRQPIWDFGRSVSREALTSQMLEELRERENSLGIEERPNFRVQLSDSAITHLAGGSGVAEHLTSRQQFEQCSADIAATIVERDLLPLWRTAGPQDQTKVADFLKYSRGFVILEISRFLIYVVQQARRIALCISLGLLMLILLFHSYNAQSPTLVAQFLAVLFVSVGVVMFQVFAGIERNHTLSRIARTNPGELDGSFWLHLIALGGLPLLGLLAHLFPPISNFLFSWVAPNLQSTR